MSGEQPPPSVTYEDLIKDHPYTYEINRTTIELDDQFGDERGSWGGGNVGKKRKIPGLSQGQGGSGGQGGYGSALVDSIQGGVGEDQRSISSNLQEEKPNTHHQQLENNTITNYTRSSFDSNLTYRDQNQNSSSSQNPNPNPNLPTSTQATSSPMVIFKKKPKLSLSRKLIEWKRELFIKRKANFISLYIDAQNALSQSANTSAGTSNSTSKVNSTTTPNSSNGNATFNSTSTRKSNLPDVSEFEKLLPALEDVNINSWTPDRQGWRSSQPLQPIKWSHRRSPHHSVNPAGDEKNKKDKNTKKKVERKGWFPEGSFEFELECKASATLRAKAREQSALLKLANELRALIITASKTAPVVTTTTTTTTTTNTSTTTNNIHNDDKSPNKTRRKIVNQGVNVPNNSSNAPATSANADPNNKEESQSMSQTHSKDSNETKTTTTGGGGSKKKPKKKKRSVLANQSNPHHVDNYRPSRTVSPHGDPYEPYTSHLSLFNPPSMIFLATRGSKRKTQNQNQNQDYSINYDVRPNEDDYICCFCEYDLYYSTESNRKKAIRRRKKEIKRKELIKSKAKNVAEGKKGSLKNGNNDSEYDSQDDEVTEDEEDGDEEGSGSDDDEFAGDEGDCHADDGHGRCTCGRRVKKPKPDKDREKGEG